MESPPRHLGIAQLLKIKDKWKNLKFSEIIANFSTNYGIIYAKHRWIIYTKYNCQPKSTYLAKIFFENKYEIKIFPENQKLREFITSTLKISLPTLNEIQNRIL